MLHSGPMDRRQIGRNYAVVHPVFWLLEILNHFLQPNIIIIIIKILNQAMLWS